MLSKINKFFSSVKLAIFLLLAIGILSIIGTLVNNGGAIFGSWYFIALSMLLIVNLVVASINAFPYALKSITGPFPSFEETRDKKRRGAVYESLGSKKDAAGILPSLKAVFGKPLYEKEVPGGGKEVYYSKNSIFRMAPYVAHISVIIILAGVLLNSLYGYRSYNNLLEGRVTGSATLMNGKGQVKLPFYIRLDKYEMKYYKNGTPSSYISKLTIFDKNRIKVFSHEITVNHPLTYKGITIYQASYGSRFRFVIYNLKDKKFKRLVLVNPGDLYNNVDVGNGESLNFGIVPAESRVKGEAPFDLAVYGDGANMNAAPIASMPFETIPAAKIKSKYPLIFARYKNIIMAYDGTIYFSGLELTKNSYVNIIWYGSIMLIISLFFSFFFSQRETWARLSPGNGGKGTSLEIISVPQKKFDSFYKNFQKKISRIKKEI